MSAAQFLADASYAAILAVPDPGQGVAPPGSENLLEVLQWAAWIAFGVCVLGFVIAGGAMAVGSQRGDGHQHGSRLAWIMAGCIVIASASGLVGALA